MTETGTETETDEQPTPTNGSQRLTSLLRWERFAWAVVAGKTLAEAYREAGYTPASDEAARAAASRLLTHPVVREMIDRARRQAVAGIEEETRERIRRTLAAIGYHDLRRVVQWDAEGNLTFTPSSELSDEDAQAIASVRSRRREVRHPDGTVVVKTDLEIRRHDPLRALELLARLDRLLEPDQATGTEVTVNVNIVQE